MRDDSQRWDAPLALDGPQRAGSVTLTPRVMRQTLISGPDVIEGALGWPDVAAGEAYTICLRRDRVLEIGGAARADGWDASHNRATSDATETYAIFDLTGPGADDVLKRGTEISQAEPSRSVARLFFGLGVFLDCVAHGYRLHVPRAQAEALSGHILAAAARF